MKLKKAIKIAKKMNKKWNFVAVDCDNKIYVYTANEGHGYRQWYCVDSDVCYLGIYTGSKNWKDTLRRVK